MTITHSQVRESIAVARSHGEKFFEQIVWQIENETWNVLGYKSWDEMRAVEYADMRGLMAPSAERPELVAKMRKSGLTQQSIAETLGVGRSTVVRDLNVSNDTFAGTTVKTERGERPAAYSKTTEVIDRETGEVLEGAVIVNTTATETPTETAARVAATAPERVNRRPITDTFWEAAYDINKKAESLHRLTQDDRFQRNLAAIASKNLAALKATASTLAEVLAAIENNSQRA